MKMWNAIKNGSKKNLIAVLTTIALTVNEFYGKPLEDNFILTLVGVVGTWLVARGVADHGAGGSVRNMVIRGTQLNETLSELVGELREGDEAEVADDPPGPE